MHTQNTHHPSYKLFTFIILAISLIAGRGALAQSKSSGKAKNKASSEKLDLSGVQGPGAATPTAGAKSATTGGDDKSTPKKDEKIDISDIENKYWAPKDTDFSVVQNRTYTKEKKYFISLGYGPLINDQYSQGSVIGVTGNYFFNERYGAQLMYFKTDLRNNDATTSLADFGGGVLPDFGRMDSYVGVGFTWVPFYAKMSLLGKKIMYFDMALTPTIGMVRYDQITENGDVSQDGLSLGLDITQYYFLTSYFAIRVDLKNQWYQEEVAKYKRTSGDPTPTGGKVRDQWNQTTILLLGVSFFY